MCMLGEIFRGVVSLILLIFVILVWRVCRWTINLKFVNFQRVFPTDLPGIPLDREIEFFLDPKPGMRPISMELYRIAPRELKKLYSQLLDLLGKGFIRLSVSL